jgi:radical SAM family uncharacterized protein/radical SAM-linked protein
MAARFANHPYAEFLELVAKPARYAGGEVGEKRRDWDAVEARICLAFPDVYDIGMSHLGYKILYGILNGDTRTLAERAYCPWIDMEAQLRERGLPLVSLESYRPLCDFDVVGFSLQFELTFSNILTMLDLGKIPLRATQRGEDDPLVVAGGPNATHPEPIAPFLDAIVIGDGEAKLRELSLVWMEAKKAGLSRIERLRKLADLGAIYVPQLYEVAIDAGTGLEVVQPPKDTTLPFPIERAMVDINDYPFPADGPTGGPEAIFDRSSIEITRGCTEGCRFCQAGMIYRPVQERDPEQVVDTVLQSVKNSGNDEVSLTALSTADVSYIHPLIKKLAPMLAEERISLSVSSLRAYGLEPELLDELKRVRAGGLTFAPEAGSQRMRDVVNKNVTEEQLQETAERVFARGYNRMKLYFMIGLPSEQDSDVEAIVDTGARTAQVARRLAGKRARVTVSVSTHVPKPHTPFQWAAMDSLDAIGRKQALLKQRVRPHRQVDLRTHDADGSVLEGIVARGDRRLADVIEDAWNKGARFDSWDDQLNLEAWRSALDRYDVDEAKYLGTLPVTAQLPWSHIDVGLEEGFLAREYRRALQDRLSPPCGKVAGRYVQHTNLQEADADKRKLVCYDCGVACDMRQMRDERLVYLRRLGANEPPVRGEELRDIATLRAQRPKPAVGDSKAGQRYRFRFEKTGAMALLGHLDVVRELQRVFRRLGEGVVYSGGFKPKPSMSFSPALSLGVSSFDEYVDLRLKRLMTDDELAQLVERMNVSSPEGLRFAEAVLLADDDIKLSKRVEAAVYWIFFARSATTEGEEGLRQRCQELMEANELWVVRRRKRIGCRRNVRPFVRSLQLADDHAGHAARAGLAGDFVVVEAAVELSSNGSVKPSELARLLLNSEEPVAHRALRVALIDGSGRRPIQLESSVAAQLQHQPNA